MKYNKCLPPPSSRWTGESYLLYLGGVYGPRSPAPPFVKMSIQKELIEKYVLLLMEYIHLVHSSEIIKQLDNSGGVFLIGFHAIAHIYKITFLITQNVESAGCYTQKGMYCYLEYIEQMNRTHTLHNLDNMDAIQFVYDKTLTDVYSPAGMASNVSHQQNMFINILSLNHPQTEEKTWKLILENLVYITNTLLWFESPEITHLQRIDLTHEYLHKTLLLYLETTPYAKPTLELLKYISIVQDKIHFTYSEYVDFLDAFYKIQKKMAKQKRLPTTETIREKSLFIAVRFPGKSYSELPKTEWGKGEGWHSPTDFVKWLFAK